MSQTTNEKLSAMNYTKQPSATSKQAGAYDILDTSGAVVFTGTAYDVEAWFCTLIPPLHFATMGKTFAVYAICPDDDNDLANHLCERNPTVAVIATIGENIILANIEPSTTPHGTKVTEYLQPTTEDSNGNSEPENPFCSLFDPSDLHREDYQATYCPEDNKIRLYVGRVKRPTYDALRKAGYTATPKQSCDFVASWDVRAENAALALISEADEIGDEDTSPEERAHNRAERFAVYRDKRATEAGGLADRVDAGPAAHGYQSERRAERAAARHDRTRVKSVSQWGKAEYWQKRTKGVIDHALHRGTAEVRRQRILVIEKALRSWHAKNSPRYAAHLTNRLIYENAMLENEGGKASEIEMIPGGWIGGNQIQRVNRSPLTKRITSVAVVVTKRDGTKTLGVRNIERLGADDYIAPTPEELAAFVPFKVERPKTPPLINPTLEDAEKLQAIWNAHAQRPAEIWPMTQAEYSTRSKHDNTKTTEVTERGLQSATHYMGHRTNGAVDVFKVRYGFKGRDFYASYSVIVITDKPQKALPWELMAELCAEQPTLEAVTQSLPELSRRLDSLQRWSEIPADLAEMFNGALYWGLAYRDSTSQYGLSKKGLALLESLQTANR